METGTISGKRERHEPRDYRLDELDFLWLEITNRCNLKCVHCYAESAPQMPLSEGMSFKKWVEVLADGAELRCRKVQFIGGEPTVHPRLLDLIDRAKTYGYDFIEVYTNGTRLSESLCADFSERDVHLAVSVYGDTSEVHDAVTCHPGSFVRTIDGIRRAVAHGIPIRAGIIMAMDENEDKIERTRSLLESIGVKSIGIDRLRGVGRGQNRLANSDPFGELCGACWRRKLAINAAGDISPCIFSHFHNVGHVKDGLHQVLKSEKLRAFRNKVKQQATLAPADRASCFPEDAGGCSPDSHCNPWCSPGCNPG